MNLLLPYHKNIIQAIFPEDSLAIFSAGVGSEFILLALVQIYQNPKNIVLILNAEKEDQLFILSNINGNDKIKIINTKMTIKKRLNCYQTDGVIFVQSRLLIYDILVRKVNLNLITGLMIFSAHNIVNNSQLQFSLKLFREQNKTAFIKSFSNFPSGFSAEFNQVSRLMKMLHAKTLFLWPRFHVNISTVLDNQEIDVVEINVPLTMHQIVMQTSIIDLLSECAQKFIKSAPELQLYKDELKVDNILSNYFCKNFQSNFHLLTSASARELYQDIKVLRNLSLSLTRLNAFDFEKKITLLKKIYSKNFVSSTVGQNGGLWILSDLAESLFIHSTQRINYITRQINQSNNLLNLKIIEELNPKWKILFDVLDEIFATTLEDSENSPKWHILIMAFPKTKIKSFFKYKKNPSRFFSKLATSLSEDPNNKNLLSNEQHPKTTNICKETDDILNHTFEVDFDGGLCRIITTMNQYIIHESLTNFKPQIIILYDTSLEWIRMLEVYKALNPDRLLRVYMIIFKNSIDEKIYLSTLNKERDSFEILIKEKACMAVPGNIGEIQKESEPFDYGDSRKMDKKVEGNIIVDVREFGSDLPLVLHSYGFNIQPITLEIGDYVLTHDVGVERKSVPDLISSLNTGRLYDQAMALSRYYTNPMLLIEFNNDLIFQSGIMSKRNRFENCYKSDSFYVQSKLLLLTLHCPLLKLLWSSSPQYTAKLFAEIKKGKIEPDSALASSVTSFETMYSLNVETNKTFDFLLRLPGVNRKNIRELNSKAKNFFALAQLPKEQLVQTLDKDGEQLYNLFNTSIKFSD
ncbi:hypothetical protein HZS_4118 [Henneguya salminicola]|nr:hypothetical protein HZS_4118 [Henneguya salminicola]